MKRVGIPEVKSEPNTSRSISVNARYPIIHLHMHWPIVLIQACIQKILHLLVSHIVNGSHRWWNWNQRYTGLNSPKR